MSSIYEFVQDQRNRYHGDFIEIAEGYEYSQYQTLRTIELYHNSRFTSGNKDALGREKPFYNICKFRVNVATRATDLDTKDVKIVSDDAGAYAQSFLLTLKNRNWMKKAGFGLILNKFGHVRAKYGGVLVKKVESGGSLKLHVMQWLNMITDQVDIANGVKIERHYYTPADLTKVASELGWTNVDGAIEAAKKTREATAAVNPGKPNRTPGATIEVYEVHGVLPTCFLAGTSGNYPDDYGAENEYERQMHVVVLDETDKDKASGVTLYAGTEDEDPYRYLPYEDVDGRGLGVGVVEDLFEAQVWTNYSVMQKKDMLDLAGKIIFQTTDQNIAARNVLTDLENGSIITTAMNTSVTQVNNAPAGLGGLVQLQSDWDEQAQNATSTYPAILGQTPPHGTAFRLQAGLVNEASALFDYRRQEAGLFLREIYRDWILPFLLKQIKDEKQLVADLNPDELAVLSQAVADYEATKMAKEKILSGELVFADEIDQIKQAARAKLTSGNRHAFTYDSEMFKDWEGTADVDMTGEQYDRQAMLSTLFQLFGSVAQNPQLLQNPTMARLFNEIVETAGASPNLQQTGQASAAAGPALPSGNQMAQQAPAPVQAAPAMPNVPALATSRA